MTITLFPPTTVRRCIRCGLPISFAFHEIPIPDGRRDRTPRAYVYVHPTPDACAADQARRTHDADPTDLGVQRARLLDARLAELCAARQDHPDAAAI